MYPVTEMLKNGVFTFKKRRLISSDIEDVLLLDGYSIKKNSTDKELLGTIFKLEYHDLETNIKVVVKEKKVGYKIFGNVIIRVFQVTHYNEIGNVISDEIFELDKIIREKE